jgi:vitamin B12 transporter
VLTGQARLALDDRTTASVAARIGDREFHFPTDFSGAIVDRNQFTFADESSVAVTLDRRIASRVTVQGKATTYSVDGGTDDRQDSPADTLGFFAFESLDSYRRNALDLRAAVELSPRATLTLGGELEQQRVRSFSASRSSFGDSNGRSSNARDNRAVYGHLTTTLGPLDANGGVRFEDNEFFGGFTTWQVGASVAATSSTRIRGVVGRAIKEPTFFESFASGFARGNPDLRPEISTSWEAGAGAVLPGGCGGAAGHRVPAVLRGSDPVHRDPSAGRGPQLLQRGPGGRPGGGAVGAGDAGGGAALRGPDAPGHRGGGCRLRQRPGRQLRGGGGAAPAAGPDRADRVGAPLGPRLRVDGVLRHVGEREDRDFNAFPAEPVTLEAYQVVDVSVSAAVLRPGESRPGIDLTLRGENLTDRDYVEVFGFRTPGRGIYLGGRIGWGR